MIYFIEEERWDGLIKIGYAKDDIDNRISVMQTGNPARLKVIGVIPSGTKQQEHDLHERFKDIRVRLIRYGRKRTTLRGEWFRPEEELRNYIASLPPFPPINNEPPLVKPLFRPRI